MSRKGSAQPIEGPPRPWSDIPLDFVGLILCCLPAHLDRVRFAAVCPQWRYAARQVLKPLPLPLLALKDGTVHSVPRGERLRFAGCDAGFTTACGKWLVYCRPGCLLLVDPFSGATMTLPAPPRIDDNDESSDDDNDSNDGDEVALMDAQDSKHSIVIKLIVCSPNLIAALFNVTQSYQIGVCRPGASSWSVARDKLLWLSYDMAFYQGKLYAVNIAEDLLAIDITMDDSTGDPHVAQIGQVINGKLKLNFKVDLEFWKRVYLVESCGSLLMVRRRIFGRHLDGEGQIQTFAEQCEPELAVFEADFRQSRWAKVKTLGDDLALFLGACSGAICTPQCDPDKRVWFLDDYNMFPSPNFIFGTDDTVIRKFSCPLPAISWRGHLGGAVWLFPPN
ncbi:unnamed protein product [Urochloa decumbens]|uniref:KIB1-4 beta-propeller domain-containing protein n=1 Tax=Urochloa decumbens TaxID=240449 RepID=A0ABC9GRV3_9POAL